MSWNRPLTSMNCANPQRNSAMNKIKCYTSSFVVIDSERINESIYKTSPFPEEQKKTVSLRANRPWGFCWLAGLWSHESNDSCCYSQSSPDFSPLITLHPWSPCDRSHHRCILWCCYMSNGPVVIISLSLIQTHTPLNSAVNLQRWGKY